MFQAIQDMDCTPSHVQAIKMRQFSQQGRLDSNVIFSILEEEKPNQKEQFKIPKERISKYFAPGTPVQKIEDTLLRHWNCTANVSAVWNDNRVTNKGALRFFFRKGVFLLLPLSAPHPLCQLNKPAKKEDRFVHLQKDVV